MAEPFSFTTGRWYNKPREDGDYAKAPLYKAGFTYDDFAYGRDYPATFLPEAPDDTLVQHSLICSKTTFLLAIDVDYPEALPDSATGGLVSWADAVSTRGPHFHVIVDMRGVPPEDWPVQGRTAWGDVKAAGFIPVPGSVHKSGALYQAADNWPSRLVAATPELLAALRCDRDDHALRRLADARQRLGLQTGTRLPDGAYLYGSGYAGGTWDQLPDGALAHDDELKDLVWDMHVEYGRPEAEVREQWDRLKLALGSEWTERDWQRHWHRVPAKRAERLEQDDATRLEEDFGLRMLPPAMEQRYTDQRADWEARAKAAAEAGTAAPTPVPDDGPFEDPTDSGGELFDWCLGVGSYARPFDAGRPSDSDNARAVLARIGPVSAYLIDRGIWLKRVGARWDDAELGANLRPVLAAVEEVMPAGCADPVKQMDLDEDDPQVGALKAQFKNLERFKATGTRSAIATACADTAIRYSGRGLATRADLLDTDPEVLWAGGVPWDLRASARVPVRAPLSRHAPHLMSAAVVPDPSAPHERWDAFKAALWPDGPGDLYEGHAADYALNVLAVAFTGYSDAVMPVLMGDPGRGKTHLVKRLIDVLGGNAPWSYGGVMNADLLRSDAKLHGTFTLDLKGKRLAFVDEAPGHGMAAQRRLKSLTGGGALQGNRMRENPVSFSPSHTLVMTANHEDPPPMDEPALQRRLRMVFFEGDVTAVEQASAAIDGSGEARAAWRAEMPYVLAEMMRRAAAWLADKHIADAERAPVRWQGKVTDEVSDQDPVLAWLDSGEVAPDQAGTRSSVLRAAFVAWCKGQGKAPGTETKWGRRLTELGFAVSRRDAGGKYRPLRVVLPGAAEFMQGGRYTATVQPTVQPENPQVSDGSLYGMYGLYSLNNTTHKTDVKQGYPQAAGESPTVNRAEKPCTVQSVHDTPSDLGIHGSVHALGAVHDNADPTSGALLYDVEGFAGEGGSPTAGVHTEKSPETGESVLDVENRTSPLVAKTPRTRLSPEEKEARALARKEKLAAERAQAREEKIAALGGRLVQLPAIVLRDQRIAEVSADTCRQWLETAYGELSVDVEHSGFPRGHKDYRLRLVQLGTAGFAAVLDPSDPGQAAVIREALAKAEVLHAHSCLADLIPLEASGLCDASAWGKMRDTLIAAKLVDPSLCDSDEAALKPLAKALLGEEQALSWKCDELRREIFAAGGWLTECEVTTPAERSGWAQIPICEAFVRYAASDVLDCSSVARVLLG